MSMTLPIEEIVAGSARPPDLEEIGRSLDGRPIAAWRGGQGPLSVSLVAGCHADEPVGPATLRRLARWLASRREHEPAVAEVRWSIVPHANPDGEAANARHVLRRLSCDGNEGQYKQRSGQISCHVVLISEIHAEFPYSATRRPNLAMHLLRTY